MDSGSYQTMSGKLVMSSPEEYEETPRDEDEMSEHEGSQQTNLFAAMSNRCPMWILQRIVRAEVMPLCSPDLQENTRQFIALAGSIFEERSKRGEQVEKSDMFVSETEADGSEGQCFIHSLGQFSDDKTPPPVVRRQFLNYVIENWRNKSATIGLCDIERTMKIEYPTLDLNDKRSIKKFRNPYVRCDHRSGFPEILHYARHYGCDFLLCSVVENVNPAETHNDCGVLTPIGYIPSFTHSTTNRPLWLLKAGVLTQEEADIAWIMHEHGAVINPDALERISHFNILTVVQPNHESEGMKHILLRTLLKNTPSSSLGSGAKLTEAASSASVLQTTELDEESEPESTESEDFFEQLVKDRKELNDRTFLRRIVQNWAETAKDQTYKADIKR